MPARIAQILVSGFLASAMLGCGQASSSRPKASSAERKAQLEAQLAKPTAVRQHDLLHGEFLVIETPVRSIAGDVDLQRCFVWRDTTFKTSSMSCDPQPSIVFGDPHAQ